MPHSTISQRRDRLRDYCTVRTAPAGIRSNSRSTTLRRGGRPTGSRAARRLKPSVLALALALQFAYTVAHADQSGTPFWTSGQFASLAAVPPSPGWSLNLTAYGYDESAGASTQLPIVRAIVLNAAQRSPSLSVQPGHAPESTLFGGQPFIGLSFGIGGNRLQGDVTGSSGVQISRSDTLYAGTDLYPFSSLGWTRGNDNWMVYLTGDIPVGAYQASRLANIGIGHAAIDGGAGCFHKTDFGRHFFVFGDHI